MSKMLRNYQYLVGKNAVRSYEGDDLKSYIEGVVAATAADVVGFAPEELDTLGEVAAALQNNPDFLTTLQGRDADLLSAIGIAAGQQRMGAMSTSELPDEETVKALFEAIGEAARRLREGLGVAQGDSDMGTFTGGVISDNASVKTALQELETYAESNSAAAVEAALDARLDVLEADPTTQTAVDNVNGALSGRLDALEADATTQSAVDTKLDAGAVSPFGLTLVDDADAATARATLGLGDAATTSAADYATAAQGAAADASLPAASVSAYGLTLVDDADAAAARTTLGLGDVATTAVADYATAAQGALADTAVQPAAISNVDNTSDADKPVSTATQSALDLKADLASPTLTGTPAAPTAAAGTNTTQIATTAFVSTAVADLIDGAPGAIDTLNELAAALGDDANFSTTITNSIAAVQADVDQNELDSDAAANALSLRIDALELDPTSATALAAVQADVDQNEADADAAIAANEVHIDNLASLSGVAKDETDLGAFTGSIIADGSNIKEAIQALETAHESFDVTQGLEDIVNGTTNFTGFKLTGTSVLTTGDELNFVDGVTSNIQDQIDNVNTVCLGAVAANEVHIDNLATLSGVAKDETDLDTFTGSTIADGSTIKAALQALETKVEAVQSDVDQNESDADTAIANLQSDVDQNEADADAAIALKADIDSPALTGTPTAPTAGVGTNTTQLATTAFVAAAVANVIDAAPGALDTLNELAAAIGDDANFATTITNSIAAVQSDVDQNELDADNAIALKLDASAVSAFGLTLVDDADAAAARTTLGLGTAATTASTDYATAAQGATADAALPAASVSAFGGTLIDDADAATARATLGLANGSTTTLSAFALTLVDDADAATARATLGLGNVDNTSDANKPVSTATQTALDLKAPLASPALTGVPTAPTAAADTNTTQIATTAYVQTELTALIDGAPAGLDTLGEIALALQEDTSAIENVTTLINNESGHVDKLATLSGVAKDSVDLGAFTGATISDNVTVKAALQALETALESINAAGPTVSAHGSFDGSGGAAFAWATDEIASHGISNVVRTGTGAYTVTFTDAFDSANYTVVGNAGAADNSGVSASPRAFTTIARTTTTMDIVVERTDDSVNTDEGYVSFMVIGTKA